MQSITLTGNLGRDAETKTSKKGLEYVTFPLAVSSRVNNEDKTTWYKLNIFNLQGVKGMLPYLKKGTRINAMGDLDVDVYKNDKNETIYSLNVAAYKVEFANTLKSSSPTVVTTSTTTTTKTAASAVASATSDPAAVNAEAADDLPF